MDPKTIALAAGGARVAIGAALLAAPGPVGSRWLGEVAERPGAKVAISGLGGRDLVIGAGTAWAVSGRKRDAGPWLIASGVADTVDLLAVLRARKALTAASAIGTVALAGGSAALCAWLYSELG